MDNTVFVAILSLSGTLLGSLGGILASNKLTNHRLLQLEKKVEAHNNMVVRMVEVEARAKSNQHRIDKLEERTV